MLPPPFKCSFWGGCYDFDGEIIWSKPIHACLQHETGGGWVLIDKGQAPLQVGYNSAYKFWEHLEKNKCLARFPYGQKYITVFCRKFKKFYCVGEEGFEKMLDESGENIDTVVSLLDRSPFERWERELAL